QASGKAHSAFRAGETNIGVHGEKINALVANVDLPPRPIPATQISAERNAELGFRRRSHNVTRGGFPVMSTRLFCSAIVILAGVVNTGQGQPPVAAQREAMKKLDFLVGQWKGEGWMEFAPGQRRTFKGAEVVQRKLDGLLVSMDGEHRGQVGGKGEEVVVHSAFAL